MSLIFSMLRHLPEGALYTAAMTAKLRAEKAKNPDDKQPEPTPEEVELDDLQRWDFDRQLQAQLINAVNLLIRRTGNWPEDKLPDFEVVGPASWSNTTGGEKSTDTKTGPKSAFDMFKEWGGGLYG